MARIVETDNFGGDYPDEEFLNIPVIQEDHAKKIADALNESMSENAPRYWKVVADDYVLQPGFEP